MPLLNFTSKFFDSQLCICFSKNLITEYNSYMSSAFLICHHILVPCSFIYSKNLKNSVKLRSDFSNSISVKNTTSFAITV